jgi:protein O-GlcNAc transferase
MEPVFQTHDKPLFYEYLDKANIYFEFGSGGSTYQATTRKNIKTVISVESDLEWHNKLKDTLKNNTNVKFIYNEMDTKPNTWGNPGPNSTIAQKINYSNQIVLLDKTLATNIDFMLIDGRFRVACCLKSFNVINNDCIIAFDDFINRPQYHVILDYFDVINKSASNIMVFLKKKADCTVPKELIEKYEIIAD